MNDIERSAIHESGHVICHYILYGDLDDIDYIEIHTDDSPIRGLCELIKDRQSLYFSELPDFSTLDGFTFWFKYMCFQIGGCCAELIICKDTEIDQEVLKYDMAIFDDLNLLHYKNFIGWESRDVSIIDSLAQVAIGFMLRLLSSNTNHQKLIESVAQKLLKQEEKDNIKRLYSAEIMDVIRNEG
ncbi:hypothetical protein [uncultured Bacteroides sp.]|uniref:hypothetical protein n=1 Tax=uncultured Bacteroides sp. TaxID=162156 RepID=UPI002AAA8D07|nr:hypothetical protein [uncultured Bacteroides sp.]